MGYRPITPAIVAVALLLAALWGGTATAIKVSLRDEQEDGSFIPERLIAEGFKLRSFKEEEINLENVFMSITKGITN